jgi:hypothetical protein
MNADHHIHIFWDLIVILVLHHHPPVSIPGSFFSFSSMAVVKNSHGILPLARLLNRSHVKIWFVPDDAS